jgi:F-box/leucine-rich repeat protein 7
MAHIAVHASSRLEEMDLTRCTTITDGGFQHWSIYPFPRLRKLVLADCTYLTDHAIVCLTNAAKALKELDLVSLISSTFPLHWNRLLTKYIKVILLRPLRHSHRSNRPRLSKPDPSKHGLLRLRSLGRLSPLHRPPPPRITSSLCARLRPCHRDGCRSRSRWVQQTHTLRCIAMSKLAAVD